jgi:hypothetical protein
METQQFIPDFLETNSVTLALPRGKRWEWLKRRIRLRATRCSFALAKERRGLRRQIERGSHEAKLHYEDRPTDAAAVAAWLDSHQLLQALHSSAAKTDVQAGILWDQYGEQSTFWFHHLARERQLKTTINHLLPQGAGKAIQLDTPGYKAS